MAFLAISTGNPGDKPVRIMDGSIWQIDEYTTSFRDSNDLRRENPGVYQRFQNSYPKSNRGNISIFIPGGRGYRESMVFYEKHLVAFQEMIKNEDFLDYYMDKNYDRHLFSNIRDFYQSMQNMKSSGAKRLYFEVMRNMIYCYFQYCKENPEAKTVDQIYEEYYKGVRIENSSLPGNKEFKQERRNLGREIDPDIEIYDQMDRVEGRFSALESFLANPHFERSYQGVLTDGYFFILGTPVDEDEQREIYQQWYDYAEYAFDGTVVCPALYKNVGWLDRINSANIVMFCIFESNLDVEKKISLVLANRSEVIIELYDISLYPKYSKKYPEATIVLCGPHNENEILDTTDSFMIDCYNHAKEKRYRKCED